MKIFKKIFRSVYKKMVVAKQQELMFWVLYSFLFIFVLARIYVYFLPHVSVLSLLSTSGGHIHHFVLGVILLAIAGFAALNDYHHKHPKQTAILYGLGLGWAFDEFGMWIYLRDNYWVRKSYDAIIIITLLLVSWVYFGNFWSTVFNKLRIRFHKKISKISA
ncbi:hypothetical protein GYA49_00095 [Candidatus Beckwithbacteria bacterium]|nr:hypothetical protein [Candidatus Beckwithbacteria bacterium]